MNYMLCRNRVRDFDQWKRVFDSHADVHRAAGLKLVHLWHEVDSPRHVFFLFEVEDMERARAFLDSDAANSAREAGLIEGDFRFFSQSLGYGPPQQATSPEPVKSPDAEKKPEPGKSPLPEKSPDAEKKPESGKSPLPEKSPDAEKKLEAETSPTLSEPVKSAEPAKSSTPPATMKGLERVKSAPQESVEGWPEDGWKPVENWPPAAEEVAVQSRPEPPRPRGRWERIKY